MLAATAADPQKYIDSDLWSMEQKFDGKRLRLTIMNNEVHGWSRKGESMHVPSAIVEECQAAPFTDAWMFDGELVGSRYVIFDLMQVQGTMLSNTAEERRSFLDKLFAKWHTESITLARNASTTAEKQAMFDECKNNLVEGVMFRRKDGLYVFNKRSTRILKWKFKKTADVFVSELNRKGKDLAIGVSLYDDDGKPHEVGGCKIKQWQVGKLQENDVIEIEYLYATNSNKVFQPVILGIRDDKDAEECTLDQLIKTNEVMI